MSEPTTIAAICSPPGPARRGVLRISGSETARLLCATVRVGDGGEAPELVARALWRGTFDDGVGAQPVLLLWMPGPRSYTREDVAELHVSGAEPLLARALARLVELGAAPAAPGEFTRRAFLNGRLDLSQAEGVLELVAATTEAECRAAGQLLEGGLSERTASQRERLEDLRALCEASLDFDESDTGHVDTEELLSLAASARAELESTLVWEVRRQPPSSLPRVVLTGAPNAGKSSLFNALVADGRALVSRLHGTTRDGLTGIWEVDGAPVVLVDGPGLDPDATGPDARAQELFEGMRRAADLTLHLIDSSAGDPDVGRGDPVDAGTGEGGHTLSVCTKADLAGRAVPQGVLHVSSKSGEGLGELTRAVRERLGASGTASGGDLGRQLFARHREALEEARRGLEQATELIASSAPLDLAAEALRQATDALDGIAGRTSPEELLDRIFSRFCIGK